MDSNKTLAIELLQEARRTATAWKIATVAATAALLAATAWNFIKGRRQ